MTAAALTLTAATIVMLHHATPGWLFATMFLVAVTATGRLCWHLDNHNKDLT